MISGTNEPTDLTICVPINAEDRAQAQAFARQQLSSDKAQRVYRNTLAVLAVNTYLQWQQFSTDLEAGDSWSPMNLIYEDAADLMITGLGKVECRPILNLEAPLPIPAELWYDRIAYIAVHLNQSATEARLLGFLPPSGPEDPRQEASFSQLQSMDDLMDYFERLELGLQILSETIAESEQLQQRWSDPNEQLMVVAQLERIYRTEKYYHWQFKVEEVLLGRDTVSDRGAPTEQTVRDRGGPTERIEDIAKRLLNRLVGVWEHQGE